MRINKNRLVETASALIDVHSFTGDEQKMAQLMVSLYERLGLQVQWQQVEEGRANALGEMVKPRDANAALAQSKKT